MGFLLSYSSVQGVTDSLYLKLRARNRCNHRDYQNLCRNGASSYDGMTYVESLARNRSDDKPVLVIYGMFGNDVCNRYTRFSFTITICLDCGFINPVTVTNKWIIHHFHLHMMWTNYLGTVRCVTPDGYLVLYVVKLSSLYIRITTKEWNFMLFVFVSLVSVHSMTTEKQRMKYENSEFCCCCQEGNIRNVCWGGGQPIALLLSFHFIFLKNMLLKFRFYINSLFGCNVKDSHHCHDCNQSLTNCISWLMCSL